jgi:hypothetical protein
MIDDELQVHFKEVRTFVHRNPDASLRPLVPTCDKGHKALNLRIIKRRAQGVWQSLSFHWLPGLCAVGQGGKDLMGWCTPG